MKNTYFNNSDLKLLTHKELLTTNGGKDLSKEGEAAGEFVGKVVKGVLTLVAIWFLKTPI